MPWVVAGAVALTVHWLVPGWWFIIAGAVSGAISAGLMDEPPEKALPSDAQGQAS
jgi:predicted branched-subunit amino acid permease